MTFYELEVETRKYVYIEHSWETVNSVECDIVSC
jgi:hypothetical protein